MKDSFKSNDIEAISLVGIFQVFFLRKYLFIFAFLVPVVTGALYVGLSEDKFSYLTLIKPAMGWRGGPVEAIQASILRLERSDVPEAVARVADGPDERFKVTVNRAGSDDLILLSSTLTESGESLARKVHEEAASRLISYHGKELKRLEERLNRQIEAVEEGIEETPDGSGGEAVLASLIERRSKLIERIESLEEASILTLAKPGMEPEGMSKSVKFAAIILASLFIAMILTLFIDFLIRVKDGMDATDADK